MSILSTICKTNHKSSRYKISLNLIDFSKLFRAVVLLTYIVFMFNNLLWWQNSKKRTYEGKTVSYF